MLKSLKIIFTNSYLIPFYLIFLAGLAYFARYAYKEVFSINDKTKKILVSIRIMVWVIIIISLINPILQYHFYKKEKDKILILIDNSLSMIIKDKNKQTRFNKVKDTLKNSTFQYLNKAFNLQHFLFNRKITPTDKENILKINNPDGDLSDIGGALLKTTLSGDKYSKNIILFSDGINNTYHDMDRITDQLIKKKIKIFSFNLSQDENIKDISIYDIDAPMEVNVNTKINLKVKINCLQYNNISIHLKTYINGKLYSSKNLNLKKGLNYVTIPLTIKKTGINTITVACDPRSDESISLNNSKTIFLRTIKSKFKVLLIYGHPTFEYKFLKLAMNKDPNIQADTFVNIKNNLSKIVYIMKYDLIIIGNIKYEDIPPVLVNNLVSYANKKSGCMLFLGGKDSFQSGNFQNSKFKDIIPVNWSKTGGFIKSEFTLALTPSGINSPAMQLVSDPAMLQDYWNNLPPCNLINIIKKTKPGTEVLATHSKDTSLIVCAIGTYKRSRIGIFTAYPTWKWGFLNIGMGYSENPFDIFWQQFIRHLVNYNLEKINLFTNKLKYKKNEDIFVTLSLFDNHYRPIQQNKVPAELFVKIRNKYKKINSFYLYPSSASKGFYEAMLSSKVYGEHMIKAGSGKYKVRTYFLIKKPEEELFKLKANKTLLLSLSKKTGGKFLNLDEVLKLKSLIGKKNIKRKIKIEKNLWSNWILLILIIGLLSTEWYIRKKNGLM